MSFLRQYDPSSLSVEEAARLDHLRTLERRFFERTDALLAGGHHPNGDIAQRAEIGKLHADIESDLGALEDVQIARLDASSAHIAQTSLWLTVLLLLSAIVALVAIGWFRREHREHLWLHLEDLRQMVAKVRGGNLDVTAEIPNSIELGALIGAFVQMAAELREMRDSLERKVTERTVKLELAHEEVVHSAKLASLGQLVSGVAHEINNPLTSILGFSEVALGRTAPGAPIHSQLQTIRSEALRLRHVVSNLTAFARRAPHRAQRFDLRTVLARLADLRGYELQADNISLHLSPPPAPVWVLADSEQLTQVMLNLVLNAEHAIKSCRERGDIWLACGAEGDAGFFSVRDNGSGMAPEVRDNIFVPFFTTKPTGEGTGLGLSISHGIIQQHHGKISVESALEEGTTIYVQVPLAPKIEENAAAPLSDGGQVRGPKSDRETNLHAEPEKEQPGAKSREALRGLVIDDEEGILEMVSVALESMNCRATLLHGSSGVEAALA
ncbi:MAG: sensor histidine kinase, partial [Candidatus Acidiferrales bacterium]